MTDSRLRSGDLITPFHGVRVSSSISEGILWECAAFQKWMHPQHAFSHLTAARLYELPLPHYAARNQSLHVLARAPLRPPKGRGITGHEIALLDGEFRTIVLRDELTGVLFGLPVCSPALVWAQMATVLDLDDLVALGDALVVDMMRSDITMGSGVLATIGELRAVALAHAGRRGAKAMLAASSRVRVGSLSRPESLLRQLIVRAGFPEPLANREATDREGSTIAMADLSWPEFRVLVEYEGDIHRTSKAKFRSDVTRGERYVDGGWWPLRATATDVFHNPNPFLLRLSRRLESAGWRPARRELAQVAASRP